MIANASHDSGPQPQFAEHRPVPESMRSSQPPGDLLKRWRLNHRYLSVDGGETLIRLKSTTYVVSDWKKSEMSVEGWGLVIPLAHSNQIVREMGRHILLLLSKAETQSLNPDERQHWLHIVTNCDMDDFIFHREMPQYMEGKVVRTTPEFRVEWQDGTVSAISKSEARALSALNVGDSFSCFSKMTRSGNVVGVGQVSLLPSIETRITEVWPKK